MTATSAFAACLSSISLSIHLSLQFRTRWITCVALRAPLSPPVPEAPPLSATGRAHCHVLLSAPWLVLQLSSGARPNCAPLCPLLLWRVTGAGRLLCD